MHRSPLLLFKVRLKENYPEDPFLNKLYVIDIRLNVSPNYEEKENVYRIIYHQEKYYKHNIINKYNSFHFVCLHLKIYFLGIISRKFCPLFYAIKIEMQMLRI